MTALRLPPPLATMLSKHRQRLLFPRHFLRKIRRWQWDSLEHNRRRQREALCTTLRLAIRHVPYYAELAKSHHLHPLRPSSVLETLADIPPMTKDVLRERFEQLHAPAFDYRYTENYSGGTTGEPVRVLQNERCLGLVERLSRLQYEWVGRTEELLVQLWGAEQDIFDRPGQKDRGIVRCAPNHYILNSFRMSDDDMLRYRRFINERKPPLIVAYVQSAYEFARFVLDNGLSVESPRGIVVSAGTLYQRHREVIEEAFGCKAYNRYGSRELHCMACECEHHEGLHLDTFCHYIELLDERQRPVTEEGGRGEIVVTLFYNPIMPLIRYRTGDLGIYTKKQCSCGRGLPLIRGVTGRTVDVFVNDAGEKIDGEYFTHLFYAVPWIKRFQVVQKSTTRLVIRAVAAGMVDEVRRGEIEDKITLVMGSRCRIEWEWVGQIEPSRSGKYRYTISELSR